MNDEEFIEALKVADLTTLIKIRDKLKIANDEHTKEEEIQCQTGHGQI